MICHSNKGSDWMVGWLVGCFLVRLSNAGKDKDKASIFPPVPIE